MFGICTNKSITTIYLVYLWVFVLTFDNVTECTAYPECLFLQLAFGYSARCIRWLGFALIRLSCCVIDVILLPCVCCKRLINSNNFICFCQSSTFPSCRCSSSIRVWSIKVKNVPIYKVFTAGLDSYLEWPSLHCVWQGTLDGFKGAVNRWLLPWVCFSVFSFFSGAGVRGVA